MFANTFQSGFISIFYSVGSTPLQLWDKQVKNGHIRRIVDDEVRSLVLEISGTNVATTYITCPIKPRLSLGIKLPFLVMIIKNMKKYFTFEIQILDDKDMHRRFRVSNFQSTTKVRPFCTTMPIGLSSGWNQVQFNLADFTKRAYGSTYLETTRVQIHANVRIRRIYFSDILYSDDELPNEYKLFLPTPGTERAARPSEVVKKKESVQKEQRESKRLSGEVPAPIPAGQAEEEPPSAAPPSPAGLDEIPPTTPEVEPPSEPVSEPTDVTAEPPTEKIDEERTIDEVTTTEPTTTDLTEPPAEGVETPLETPDETPVEQPTEEPPEGEVFVEALETQPEAPVEGEPVVAEEEPAMIEIESAIIEEPIPEVAEEPREEAPPAEEAPVEEVPVEEVPAEEVPTEEAPAEEEAAAEEAT